MEELETFVQNLRTSDVRVARSRRTEVLLKTEELFDERLDVVF